MTKNIRKITSLMLTLVLVMLVFSPTAVSAAEADRVANATAELVTASASALYSVRGKEASPAIRQSLTSYNMSINNNTLIEILPTTENDATILCATNTDGALITKSTLMAIGEDGNLISFTAADVAAAATDLSGGSTTVNPFGNSFKITFIISYYAYPYSTDAKGIVQPQTAMFIYYDDNDQYNITQLTMKYKCYGVEGYFDGSNFTAISGPLDGYKYTITVSKSSPHSSAYYSTNSPISSNKAILMNYEPGGVHKIEYSLKGTTSNGYNPFEWTRETQIS